MFDRQAIRINAVQYGSVVIERRDSTGKWHVPDWAERGLPSLHGPFDTLDAAREILRLDADYIRSWGFDISREVK